MENEYIGRPKDFHYMEGSEAINFRKTFDLNGTQNDEMLRLYLRKAGLSDEIECLTIEQRRAFIYDIIKSNKMPGYWRPSTMQNSNYNVQRPNRLPPPPPPTSSVSSLQNFKSTNPSNNPTKNYGTMRSSVSTGNLQRFIPAPTTPPTPSTFVTSSKGRQYEVSGPFNFQHTAGDMNRDMSRNAFDLTQSSSDNVLRKYMMERGIVEEDIAGIRKTDLIRKIVQSKFTWIPSKKNKSTNNMNSTSTGNLRLNYATISGYPDSKNSKMYDRPALNVSISPTTSDSKPDFSNFTLVTSRFADVRLFPSPDELNRTKVTSTSEIGVIPLPPLPPGIQLPAPPPRKSQYSSASLPTIKRNASPPPLVIAAQPKKSSIFYSTLPRDYDNNFEFDPLYMTLREQKPNEPDYATVDDIRKPPPTPPKPSFAKNLPSPTIKVRTGKIPPTLTAGMGKVQTSPLTPGVPLPPPPPAFMLEKGVTVAKTNSIPPKPNGCIPPPPTPHTSRLEIVGPAVLEKSTAKTSENPRDDFLESIRKGVNLKKVDQKSATISGIKPRADRRPQITDFLTELKNVTSRQTKTLEENASKEDEAKEWND